MQIFQNKKAVHLFTHNSAVFLYQTKSAFICNRDEISSQDETRPGVKKILFTREFHPGMKRVEFHPGMKFNLKENLPLSMMKTFKISVEIKFLIFSIIEIRSLIC